MEQRVSTGLSMTPEELRIKQGDEPPGRFCGNSVSHKCAPYPHGPLVSVGLCC